MSSPGQAQLAHWIWQACEWEVLAPKAGNVHPAARFEDVCAEDFLRSARILADYVAEPLVPLHAPTGVSTAVLKVIERVQQQIGKNTNLGIVLLLVPLAAVPLQTPLKQGIEAVVAGLDVADSERIFQAIRLTQPGGLQQVAEQDVSLQPTLPVQEVMQLAADRDAIARQYANNFQDVLGLGIDRLQHWWLRTAGDWQSTVVGLHLEWMAVFPDSLIARKLGPAMAELSAGKAAEVLAAGWPETAESRILFQQFDTWLRADGNRRNPGTSADLVAATLFVGFRVGIFH